MLFKNFVPVVKLGCGCALGLFLFFAGIPAGLVGRVNQMIEAGELESGKGRISLFG
jgi:hypothetical protein